MLVYIFNENFFSKIKLPIKVDGVYTINAQKGKFLASVEEINGAWHIRNNDDIVLYKNDKESLDPEIKLFENYKIALKSTNESYNILATPIFDENRFYVSANIGAITIGSSVNDDIFFENQMLLSGHISISVKDNIWHLSTSSNNVYVTGKRVNEYDLKYGDYIFCNGLKIITIGKQFIINNPNGKVKLKTGSFDDKPLGVIKTPTNLKNIQVNEEIPLYTPEEYFIKSPRFKTVLEPSQVIIDPPPPEVKKDETPIILTIGPQLTMLSTSGFMVYNYISSYMSGQATKESFIISISTVGIMMVGTFLWPQVTRLYNNHRIKKLEKKRQKKYKEYLEKKREEISLIKSKQKQILIEHNVTLENCKLTIENRSRQLWERNIEHDDFLQVRIGTGRVPARIQIAHPMESFSLEDKDKLVSSLEDVIKTADYIEEAPYDINLKQRYVTGIVGKEELVKKFLDNIFLQIMTFHSFTDLKIVVFTNKYNESKWNYLRILPHCWNNSKTLRYFATTIEEMNTISSSLVDIVEGRIEALSGKTENEESTSSFRPYYLIFTDDIESARKTMLLKRVLETNSNIGFSLLMANDRLATLPQETATFVNIGEKTGGVIGNQLLVDRNTEFIVDYGDDVNVYDCAAKLANIPVQTEKAKYELPSSISFLQMYNVGRVEQLNSLERWVNNNPVNSLSVPVGIDQNGELFKVDLHEKAYGPHGLVAGTTGSGKSEWIVTLILSLAVNFNPDEVQFVLIDYKGGGLAMSFENQEMGIKLPHLAGTITNLDKSAVNRAIASIESELKRRQAIFNAAREKLKESSMNIYKYQQFYRKGMVDEPLSHLFLISDEFAELKSQQPEFMEQLISTSRIGRSLGVHLILATQKPSGVVNDQIWSNSRFKICFRVQDKSDSNEILKKPDAAYLKQVGAFYFEVGNDEYYNLGQSAWAGAKYYPRNAVKKEIDQSVQSINDLGQVINYYDEQVDEENIQAHGEELLNVISYIDKISKKEDFVEKQLWLPNIPTQIYLGNIKQTYAHKASYMDFNTVIGIYDEPRAQLQNVLKINLKEGNVAIFGQMESGTDELISTIMFSSITDHTPKEINYYVVDFGTEILRMYSKFPHVGEIVTQESMDRIPSVLQLIFEEFDKRKKIFADYNASFDYYNSKNENPVPLIVCVINAFDIFTESMPKIADVLNSLFRDAPRYGIVFICSVSSMSGLRQRQLQYFNHVIVLEMSDDSAYRTLTDCRRGLIPMKTLGRGICRTGVDSNSYCEFQTAFIAKEDDLLDYVKETAKKFAEAYKEGAKKIVTIPDTVGSSDLIKYSTGINEIPIGFNFFEKDIAKLDLSNEGIYLITSKNLNQNIKFLYAFTELLSKTPGIKVRVIDFLNIFNKPILDIKLFNDNLDAVFAALEADANERDETQDIAINIIIGAGVMKKYLTSGGYEIATNIFEHIKAINRVKFIFIDNYDKLRTLKLETWFNYLDTTKGLWLGREVENQSLFITNEIDQSVLKYNFEGLGYVINNSEVSLVKTMMDSEE